MPFKSEAQRRLFHAKADRGEISEKKVREWEHETPKKVKENLPYHVKKSAEQIADEVLAKLGVAAFTASPAVGRKQLLQSFKKKPAAGMPPEQPKSIEWRKAQDPKPTGEMLKFFSLKEGQGMGMPTEKPFMQQSPAAAASRQLGGTGAAGSPAGGGSSGGGGRVGMASYKEAKLPAASGKALELANILKSPQHRSAVNRATASKAVQTSQAAAEKARAAHAYVKGVADKAVSAQAGRAGKAAGKLRESYGLPGTVRTAGVDPAVLEASLMRAEAGPSKLWQGLTGLSDDILAAGMRAREKAERRAQKHAAQQLASSVSMLTKMSEVAKKDVAGFFRDNPNPQDPQLHAWAEGKGEEPDKVEAKAYELATAEAKKQGKGDKITGGKADDKPKSDFSPKQVAMGKKVEQEHTDDPALAAEIATDHLEEIPDYYDRLKKMEDAAPKKEAGLLPVPQQEQPVSLAAPLTPVSPDILQLIKAQALIDQQKLAQPYDTGDVRIPYQREQEAVEAPQMEQDQTDRQAMYERQLAEQMRAQRIEHEYTGKVRRGELFGGLGGLAAGAGLGYALSKPGGRFFPMAAGGAVAGLLGKGLGRHVGQQQGLDYLRQYTGVPWAVQ